MKLYKPISFTGSKSFLPSLCMVLITAGGCSNGPMIQEIPETANVVQEINTLDADLVVATSNQINVLSPNNFEESYDSLVSAKQSLEKQKSSKNTLYQVAKGRAYLNRANEMATLSHTNMEEVVAARKQALLANAPELFPADFRDLDDNLKDVTSEIENNDISSAEKYRTELQNSYLAIELRAIKQSNLGPAQDTIAQAVKEGAKKFARQSLAIAEKSYKDTDAYITANRHAPKKILIRVNELNKNADHLLKITRISKDSKKMSSEELALQMEGKQNQIEDKQNEIVDKQNQIDNKQDQINDKQAELSNEQVVTQSLTAQNQTLESGNAALESEKSFNGKFENARSAFNKDEAEVYKQGNTLTIRLRGLEFPSAQAVLKESNFALLAKVQDVIEDFGDSSVTVEGHTDSLGGKDANTKLSEQRAIAVRAYLISNNAVTESRIKAIGYGYQKPLASNKTVSGRAQNRRVDILISPDQTQSL